MMAEQRRMRRQNFLNRNKLQAVSVPVLFTVILLKMIFLEKKAPYRGMDFYFTTFTFVFVIAMILALTIREVVRRAVAYRNSRSQYKNAVRMMKTGAVAGFLLGVFILLILMFTAGKITNLVFLQQAYGTFPMILASLGIPFLFFSAALLGAFDGFGFEMPDGTSKIIFAVSDLLFSILLIFLACRIGEKHGKLLHDDCVVDAFGASGAAAGFAAASILTMIWLTVLAMAFRRKMHGKISEDISRTQENFPEQIIGLLSACGQPFLRYAALYGTIIINQILFFVLFKTPLNEQGSEVIVSNIYAYQYGMQFIWYLIPFGLTLLLTGYSCDYLEKIMKKDDLYHCGMRIIGGIKQYLCLILPSVCVLGVCLSALHETVFSFPSSPFLVTIVFSLFGFGMLEAGMLKGLGKEWIGILCSLVAFLIQTTAAVFVLDEARILYCNLIYAVIYAVGCGIFLIRYCVYRKHLLTHLILPFAAIFAAVIAAVLCMFLKAAIGVIPAVILALIISAFVHMLVLIVTGCIRENELHEFPQGSILAAIGRLLGIYS